MISAWYTTAMKGDAKAGTMPCSRHLPNWGYLIISMLKSGNALSSQMRFTPGRNTSKSAGLDVVQLYPVFNGRKSGQSLKNSEHKWRVPNCAKWAMPCMRLLFCLKKNRFNYLIAVLRSMKLKISVPRHLLLFAAWFPSRPTICLLSGMGISVFIAIRSFLVSVVLTSVVVAVKN